MNKCIQIEFTILLIFYIFDYYTGVEYTFYSKKVNVQ